MADTTTFAIPKDALEPWMLRFAELGYETNGPITRFGENILGVLDPDGLRIELVAEADQESHSSSTEEFQNRIPAKHAIRRLHSVSLCVEAPERMARLLTETFGYELIGEEPTRQRFAPEAVAPPESWISSAARS
jgi:glyoxalase family protein